MRSALGAGRYAVSHPPEDEHIATPENLREWHPASVIPMALILDMATVAGAAPLGLENQVGTLTPGKAADLILLRADHLNYYPINKAVDAVVVAADTGCIDAVFVAGKAVKYNGRIVNDALVRRARKLALQSRDYLMAKAGIALPEGLHPRTA
jgi:cytosine/adenosine deaminase-related metal-dependent hydrolase